MKRLLDQAGPGAVLLAVAALLLAWDTSGLDMALARWAGSAHGFASRDDWWLTTVLHDDVRYAAWALVVLLCAGVVWPVGPMAKLPFKRRLQMPATALAATAMVVVLKGFSATSCPWDLADFGGVAHHVSHWAGWRLPDGGGGHCFPAGHASTGFAFVGGWFAWREQMPGVARAWGLGALAAGLLLGFAQQWRGAHFMSHTLWSGWVCAVVAWALDPLFACRNEEALA